MFVTSRLAPEKRRAHAAEGIELRFSEAAVMLAFALHLLDRANGEAVVRIHPDGEHAKIFDIGGLLSATGFVREQALGTTPYGGHYRRGAQMIIVNPSSGKGDVVAEFAGQTIVAECKGGTINSTHAGQKSRLRKGLAELIGQLMIRPQGNERQIAVLPFTVEIERLAKRLAPRCTAAGIQIALIHQDGAVRYVAPNGG